MLNLFFIRLAALEACFNVLNEMANFLIAENPSDLSQLIQITL